ncbi:hypothetical protein ABPG74_019239 [Tetrahymena malaccensis]
MGFSKTFYIFVYLEMLFISLLIIFSWHPSDQAIDCKLSILKYPHRQKSQGLISGVLGGHQFQFIKWLPNLDVSHYFLNPIVNGSKGYTDQFHNSSCSLSKVMVNNQKFYFLMNIWIENHIKIVVLLIYYCTHIQIYFSQFFKLFRNLNLNFSMLIYTKQEQCVKPLSYY